jgi:hypothetical protein
VVKGRYVSRDTAISRKQRVVFTDIRPLTPMENATKKLTGHITFDREEILPYFSLNPSDNEKEFIMICRPYIYIGKNGKERGGLRLTNELASYEIPPISEAHNFPVNLLPWEKLIDYKDILIRSGSEVMDTTSITVSDNSTSSSPNIISFDDYYLISSSAQKVSAQIRRKRRKEKKRLLRQFISNTSNRFIYCIDMDDINVLDYYDRKDELIL